MKEFLITFLITVIVYIIAKFIPVNDEVLKSLIELIPVAIPTISLWIYTPKNYLKFISLKSIDITYDLIISFKGSIISQEDFKNIINELRHLYQNDSIGKILNENFGQYLLTTTLEVDTTIIKVDYYLDTQELLIQSKDKIKYKSFFKLAQVLFDKLVSLFATKIDHYESNSISLEIYFKEKTVNTDNDKCKNPFLKKIFQGFRHKIISFTYRTKNNSIVEISNDSIRFNSEDIKKINEDINNELRFFLLRN